MTPYTRHASLVSDTDSRAQNGSIHCIVSDVTDTQPSTKWQHSPMSLRGFQTSIFIKLGEKLICVFRRKKNLLFLLDFGFPSSERLLTTCRWGRSSEHMYVITAGYRAGCQVSAGKIHVATDVRAPTSTGTIHPSMHEASFRSYQSLPGEVNDATATSNKQRERERENARESKGSAEVLKLSVASLVSVFLPVC